MHDPRSSGCSVIGDHMQGHFSSVGGISHKLTFKWVRLPSSQCGDISPSDISPKGMRIGC